MNNPPKRNPLIRCLASATTSISALKQNPGAIFKAARDQQILVFSNNRPVGYILSPEAWAGLLDFLDGLDDGGAADEKLRMLGLR